MGPGRCSPSPDLHCIQAYACLWSVVLYVCVSIFVIFGHQESGVSPLVIAGTQRTQSRIN